MNENSTLVFERPPVTKILSIAAALGSAGIFFLYLADHPEDYRFVPMIALGLLFLGTVAASVIQYGDHIFMSDEGVKYENRLLAIFGRKGSWIHWEDIVEIREVRNRMLILLSRDGRRLLVDAILGYSIARAEIVRRAPQAILSGTLTGEE